MAEAKIKKAWYKQWWAIVLFTIIGFIIFVSIISDNQTTTKGSNSAIPNQTQTRTPAEKICIPNWQCHDWSECNSGGIQTRDCFDLNYCDDTKGKPAESQSCKITYGNTTFLSNTIQQINSEPYYSVYCNKIDPFDLDVRETASMAVRNHSGKYNILQILDIYDWVKDNIIYLNVPVTLSGSPYNPSETLTTKSGDCKNQAVLLASMIDSIGGAAKVVLIPECEHAYVLVYFGNNESGFNELLYDTQFYYNKPLSFSYYKENDNFWVKFDTAGGMYPGETLPECDNVKEVYTVSSCASMHS